MTPSFCKYVDIFLLFYTASDPLLLFVFPFSPRRLLFLVEDTGFVSLSRTLLLNTFQTRESPIFRCSSSLQIRSTVVDHLTPTFLPLRFVATTMPPFQLFFDIEVPFNIEWKCFLRLQDMSFLCLLF